MTHPDTLTRLRERTAARKAAGQIPAAYPVGDRPPKRSAAPARVSLPCVHLGEELAGPARQERGLGHARKWSYCGHPDRPLGEVVCRCKGCGPKCPGYAGSESKAGTGHGEK